MNENIKKLNELAVTDEALRSKLKDVRDNAALIALAAEKGITLTEADLNQAIVDQGKAELSDDELSAVANKDWCFCAVFGWGHMGDMVCTGEGKADFGNGHKCYCMVGGGGD